MRRQSDRRHRATPRLIVIAALEPKKFFCRPWRKTDPKRKTKNEKRKTKNGKAKSGRADEPTHTPTPPLSLKASLFLLLFFIILIFYYSELLN